MGRLFIDSQGEWGEKRDEGRFAYCFTGREERRGKGEEYASCLRGM